ncbi:hypothetical protein KOW79_020088 [Hemibagrus wyckioides]|uniref:G-protein coupled receptor family C group 6 member A n=1 Tax=Hemibagrus wyckioides TaxID=337641 RepID=A0A9D3N8X2_9TELE|nr:hypothetical protein KOW79_020088 [Hemibagrus wyckioides]
MCDACVYGTKALDCVERMLAVNGPPTLLPDYSNFTSPIKALLGERYSELSIPIAKLLSLYMIPQISCTSTAPALSDKLRYASFFRVVPSDLYQTKALAKLMSHYSWNWIGVVTLDDDYGRAVLENFVQDAQKEQVCLHYQKILPNYLGSSDIEEKIINVADQIESSNATVVLLILRPEHVQMIFQEMIKRNVSRVWIASDAWSTARFLMKMKDINKVGDIFGFTFITGDIPGFADYVRNIRPSPGARNDFITEYKQMRSNCAQGQESQNPFFLYCNNTDDSFLLQTVDLTEAFSQRVAVYAIANAIKKLLKCDDTSCSEDTNFLPWKLISILRNMNFTVDNQTYFFNKDGDFENGYDLIMWKKDGDERILDVVGKYLISNNNVDVYEQKISWFNNTVPESRCSKKCPKGTHKNILNITCCYTCISCAAGEYSDQEDQAMCSKCLNGTSNAEATKCVEWKISCSSTAPALSDKLRYASFFRVVPSDLYQTKALAKLMSHYSWNWIGMVTLDDDYGRAVLENIVQDAQKEQVCLHYQKILPNYLGSSDIGEKIINVADQIESSNATVVLLILRAELVQMIFQEMIKRNVSRVWIASDSWSTARFLMKMKDINKVGDIFGFTFIFKDIPGFKDYVRNIRPSPGARNDFITEYKQMRSNCAQGQESQNPFFLYCNNTDDSFLLQNVDLTQAYGQRVAVYAIANAIKKLLKYDDTSCSEDTNFLPWKLISILRNMNFTVDNQTYFFNKNGDFENGYDLIMWKKDAVLLENIQTRRIKQPVQSV